MRVLAFIHSFEPGGVERVALRLLSAWRTSGLDVELAVGREDGDMRREWPGLAYMSFQPRRLETAAFETLWMIAHLPRAIRHTRPDVLFCAGSTYTVVAVVMKLLLGRSCPPVVAKISNDLGRSDITGLIRWFYKQWLQIQGRWIDRLVAMSEPMRAEIIEAMKVSPAKVVVVNDPSVTTAEIDWLEQHERDGKLSNQGTRYLGVGRLVPQKNFALLLRAFAAARQDGDTLTIVGGGPEQAELVALGAELGIADVLTMPGHVSSVLGYFTNSDVFVLSSDYEGIPAAIIEALAAGLRIVATDCSVGIASLLDHGELGEIVPRRDQGRLQQAMLAAASRPHCTARARERARMFTVEPAARTYAAVFAEAM